MRSHQQTIIRRISSYQVVPRSESVRVTLQKFIAGVNVTRPCRSMSWTSISTFDKPSESTYTIPHVGKVGAEQVLRDRNPAIGGGNQVSTLIYAELFMEPREQPLSQKLPKNKFHCPIENSYDEQIFKEVYICLQLVCCCR